MDNNVLLAFTLWRLCMSHCQWAFVLNNSVEMLFVCNSLYVFAVLRRFGLQWTFPMMGESILEQTAIPK